MSKHSFVYFICWVGNIVCSYQHTHYHQHQHHHHRVKDHYPRTPPDYGHYDGRSNINVGRGRFYRRGRDVFIECVFPEKSHSSSYISNIVWHRKKPGLNHRYDYLNSWHEIFNVCCCFQVWCRLSIHRSRLPRPVQGRDFGRRKRIEIGDPQLSQLRRRRRTLQMFRHKN